MSRRQRPSDRQSDQPQATPSAVAKGRVMFTRDREQRQQRQVPGSKVTAGRELFAVERERRDGGRRL